MKSFEIYLNNNEREDDYYMNYKLEKFWNCEEDERSKACKKWTINLKSFEITMMDTQTISQF